MKKDSQKLESGADRPVPRLIRIIKTGLLCFGLAAAILSGCAGSQHSLVLDTVGPAPTNAANTKAATGSLVVFTAREAIANFDPLRDSWASDSYGSSNGIGYTWDYTRYKIMTPEGKTVLSVNNNVGNTVPHPKQVELPTGNYWIEAKSTGYGRIKVPVEIVGGQITVLHLDGGSFWPREFGLSETNSVHLPNGNIVGWRSAAEIARTP